MAKVNWPAPDKRTFIGKRISRVDGPAKSTGAAKYSYDQNRPNMLWAKVVTSPYARAELVSIDASAAKALKGVEAVWQDDALIGLDQNGNGKIQYTGQIVGA